MELVIGAAGQNMCEIIMLKYDLIDKQDEEKCSIFEIPGYCDGDTCSKDELYSANIINNFQSYVKRNSGELGNKDVLEELLVHLTSKEKIIIGNEIGYGIVPIHKEDRDYRELYGRIMCRLSEKADRVTRVVCGICQVIKGDK